MVAKGEHGMGTPLMIATCATRSRPRASRGGAPSATNPKSPQGTHVGEAGLSPIYLLGLACFWFLPPALRSVNGPPKCASTTTSCGAGPPNGRSSGIGG